MTKVTIEKVLGQPYKHLLKARGHEVVTDAPAANKGGNTGMTPHELFLAGLGACTAMTIEMFADKRGWALTKVMVILSEDTVADPDNAGSKIPRITETIELEGTLSESQVAKLKAIAYKCQVYNLFVGKKQMEKQLSFKASPGQPAATESSPETAGSA